MNKLRSSNIVRPDAREDGLVRTSNITKFLAACASYGLANEDLFLRDDLIKGSKEGAARVARTVTRLVAFVEECEAEGTVKRVERERAEERTRERRKSTSSSAIRGADNNLDSGPRLIRGLFQSDIEGSSSAAARRRVRPSSYDELGAPRTRFESMVNLGATSGTTATDLDDPLSTDIPGGMPNDAKKHRSKSSNSSCRIQ
jgi:hypothetical protein